MTDDTPTAGTTDESDSTHDAAGLLSCPFCGKWPYLSTDEHSTVIECLDAECVRPSWCDEPHRDGDDEHLARAIARWNTRSVLPNGHPSP